MSATERLLAAIVQLQHYVIHDVNPDECTVCPRWDELQQAAMALVAEVEALRADAERYRWLRRGGCGADEARYMVEIVGSYWEENMDAAIDAARAER